MNAGFNSQDIMCLFTSKAVTKFHDSNRDAETENCQACVKCYYLICYLKTLLFPFCSFFEQYFML